MGAGCACHVPTPLAGAIRRHVAPALSNTGSLGAGLAEQLARRSVRQLVDWPGAAGAPLGAA